VPDQLWRCTNFGAGKPFADDQADDMMQEAKGLADFDLWVRGFIAHVENKGVVAAKADESAAQSTTNTGKSHA
jgi:hypothetical protein